MSSDKGNAVVETLEKPGKITGRDLFKAWIHWQFNAETGLSYERLQALGFVHALMPILRKLYPKGGEEFKNALKRHLIFFNTQAIWGGGTILGISAGLEEERANELYEMKEEVLDPALIVSTKTGLMGPFAGIGDSIDWATFQYLLLALFLPAAKSGMWIAGVAPWIIFVAATYTYGFYFVKSGYRLGRAAASQILQSGAINKIILGAGVLGLFMMGVLAASYVNVSSSLTWTLSGEKFEVQKILDNILPGLLPFATVALSYLFFTKKGLKINQLVLYIIVIFFVLGFIGVL
jgi:mannose/fructose/N-acetylgalactosamine-specific phosphotransferase system component IID